MHRDQDTEIAVVGAGPAGLAAAAAAGAAGCQVVLVDAYARPGGQYFRQLPTEFHARRPGALHHDFAVAERLLAELERRPNVQVLSGTTVWSAQAAPPSDEWHTLYLTDGLGSWELRAGAVILAPGAYDRALPFPGWDLPGVLTAGGAQALVKGQRVLPGRRVVLAGSGPFLLPVATALAEAGAELLAVCEATTPRGWLREAARAWTQGDKLAEGAGYAWRLGRRRVPIRFGTAVVRAEGNGRVQRVTLARLAADWTLLDGGTEQLEADVVCSGYGFVPSTELAIQLGCGHRYHPVQGVTCTLHDGEMRATRAGVYVAGEINGIGGSAVALAQGAIAGLAAARAAGRLSEPEAQRRLAPHRAQLRRQHAFAGTLNRLFAVQPGWRRWLTPATTICRCEEAPLAAIQAAVADLGARDVKAVKALTRCGMGLCQGRLCGYAVTALTAALSGRDPAAVGTLASRPIARPVALESLL